MTADQTDLPKHSDSPADQGPAASCGEGSAPWSESDRLAALERYDILDTPREPEFDDVARLAADIFDAPIAVVNLIAEGRQWFKAEVGIGADELPLDVSICVHAILQPGIFVVPDTTKDDRFSSNPLVCGEPGLRFYAGALLETPDGLPLGTVCVLDTTARPEGITDRQRLTLEVLARQVMTQLELRRAVAERERRAEQLRSEVEPARRRPQQHPNGGVPDGSPPALRLRQRRRGKADRLPLRRDARPRTARRSPSHPAGRFPLPT
jgi:hypothetical protein